MEDKVGDFFCFFAMTDADLKYQKVKEGFDAYFVKHKSVTFERARFNQHKQEEDKSVEAFIASLCKLTEHSSYGTMLDEVIRDQFVVGLHNASLSRKLLLKADLTLDSAITTVRQRQ